MAQGLHEDTAREWSEPADTATTSATEETLGLRTSPLPGRGPGLLSGSRPSRPSAGASPPGRTLQGLGSALSDWILIIYCVIYYFSCGRGTHLLCPPERDERPWLRGGRSPASGVSAARPSRLRPSAPGGWVPAGRRGLLAAAGGWVGRAGGPAASSSTVPPTSTPPPSPVSVFLSLVGGGGNGGWWVVAPAAAAVRDDEFLLRAERGQPGRLSL